jgi:tetratricopeptide (TPR) repeat protein
VSYLTMAERLRDGTIARRLAAPEALHAQIEANPWLGYVKPRLMKEWSRVLMHAGEACRRMGRLAQARKYLDESIRLAPDDAYARLFRGQLELALGRKAQASADLRLADRSDVPGVAAWAAAVEKR